MKKYGIIPILFLPLFSFAQHELRIGLNSGFSAFSGNSAVSTTFINHSEVNTYANSPVGEKLTFSYGLSANYKLVNKRFILGVDAGYENLKTKTEVTHYTDFAGMVLTNGKVVLSGHFATFSPFLGYRIPLKDNSLDIQAGVDLQFLLKDGFDEKGKFKLLSGEDIKYENQRSFINKDFRPRLQINYNFSKYSVYAGYSLGIKNYYEDYVGGSLQAHMNTLRFGLQYRLL